MFIYIHTYILYMYVCIYMKYTKRQIMTQFNSLDGNTSDTPRMVLPHCPNGFTAGLKRPERISLSSPFRMPIEWTEARPPCCVCYSQSGGTNQSPLVQAEQLAVRSGGWVTVKCEVAVHKSHFIMLGRHVKWSLLAKNTCQQISNRRVFTLL